MRLHLLDFLRSAESAPVPKVSQRGAVLPLKYGSRSEAEQGRVAIRNIRREANNEFKEMVKEKMISEDDERRGQETIQKLTDKYVKEVDQVLEAKEKDLMAI